jgi:hypothetical protein
MSKQTAVEWLVKQLLANGDIRWRGTTIHDLAEQAKAMEKEQIIDALDVGYQIANEDVKFKHIQTTEQYYQETYGGDQ